MEKIKQRLCSSFEEVQGRCCIFEYLIGCVFLILKALSKFYAVDWIVELGMKKPPKWVAKSHKISLLNRIDQVLSLFLK